MTRAKVTRACIDVAVDAPASIRPAALREADAAKYLDVSIAFLRDARIGRSSGPPFVRISRKVVRYLRADLDRWLESKRVLTKAGNR